MAGGSVVRVWRPGWPCEPYDVLRVLRRGGRDPAFQRDGDGTIWRASTTPAGTSTLRIRSRRALGQVELEAWGSGAEWALDNAPALLGAFDDAHGFEPSNPNVRAAWNRNPHWRITRTGLVMEALVPAVIEQKVTGMEAWLGWRLLLRRFGSAAPGPAGARGMRCPPTALELALVASWDWLRCHIDAKRSDTIVRAAKLARAIERTVGLPEADADRRLRSLPGIGAWTSAETRQRAHGHADAVSFGDYHVASHIGYALTGERIDDEQLAQVLEPDRPHRYRVQHVVTTRMAGPPRHGPRMAPRTHLPR
ncbi:MAG: DNA-3-methyladenine glycosylase 2 family protein [Nocardioidaceae bacterium]